MAHHGFGKGDGDVREGSEGAGDDDGVLRLWRGMAKLLGMSTGFDEL